MASCPQCDRPVREDAVSCPHCRYPLKAFGHPGIPLHRATDDGFLCSSCTYHHDDTCNFPQRPYAETCTLYHNVEEAIAPETLPPWKRPTPWYRRYRLLWPVLGLLVLSFVLATL
ncbi:hypothetical protein CKA32_000376 [Geitlerinema sp. FC II]|uniref:zinc ribbon domain-containing protein n=1 Tax=Baaleninema simplex TaxID=2862350 RepID=UPI00035D7F7D|nr:zinc ribbon domain-containing protein [Baaleninema simplex]PPT11267.1 hypothetical protein CKA32_000376 [Geitlerinema sp. FC II]